MFYFGQTASPVLANSLESHNLEYDAGVSLATRRVAYHHAIFALDGAVLLQGEFA